jgi:enoyl-CoA hydratase/carnithine racemase
VSPFRGSAAFTESWQNFDFALEDGVATVTFSRSEKLNALTFDVYADLRDLLGELPHRGDARVLVLTGEGRGFCSGGDVEEIIGELQKMSAGELLDFTRMSGAVVKAMREAPLPIVASVNGIAAGAGAVLALAADLRLVASSASRVPPRGWRPEDRRPPYCSSPVAWCDQPPRRRGRCRRRSGNRTRDAGRRRR